VDGEGDGGGGVGFVVSTVKDWETTMANINAIIEPNASRHHLNRRLCLLSPFAFSSMTREPSFHFSLPGSTLTSGVPSARQKANESFAE
jgi:hypothetical protein